MYFFLLMFIVVQNRYYVIAVYRFSDKMSDTVSKAPKPQLRGLLHSQIKRNIWVAVAMCFTAAVAQKFLINDHRKQVYAEFYKYKLELC